MANDVLQTCVYDDVGPGQRAERVLLTQLEQRYGPLLDEMTDDALADLIRLQRPAALLPLTRYGRTSPLVRPDLLRALAQRTN